MRIYLVGMPGSGKSTLGKRLALKLSLPFMDLDSLIEFEQGISVQEIFRESGEDHFRNLESSCLQAIEGDGVVATGGGTPCFNDNMQYMNRSGITVWMDTPLDILHSRMLSGGTGHRPLMQGRTDLREYLDDMMKKRLPFYEQAKIYLFTDREDPLPELLSQLRS